MPKFTCHIDREVTTWDRFTRIIEAETEDEARGIADGIANAADSSCPDDAAPSGHDTELGSWGLNEIREADADDLALFGDVEAPLACANCGTTDQDGSGICPDCGQPLEDDEDEDNYCPGCGVPMGDDHAEDCEEGTDHE